ncbi:MAG: 16S rRNA (guanine(527)-N(7))-methyltransferase RsmG [Candidatus Nanopelagicales bacterium]
MEELPAPPSALADVVADAAQRERMTHYAALLASAGVERGLIGPREVPRLWDRHLLNCAVAVPLVPADADVIDVGSGAGLPGIVWAIARPDLRVTCLEPLQRRATFLEEVVTALDLGDRVQVVRARAEDIVRGRGPVTSLRARVVTARAVAPLERLAGWTVPLVQPGGELLALKGRSAAEEVHASATVLERLGIARVEVVECGLGVVDPPTTVVRAVKS